MIALTDNNNTNDSSLKSYSQKILYEKEFKNKVTFETHGRKRKREKSILDQNNKKKRYHGKDKKDIIKREIVVLLSKSIINLLKYVFSKLCPGKRIRVSPIKREITSFITKNPQVDKLKKYTYKGKEYTIPTLKDRLNYTIPDFMSFPISTKREDQNISSLEKFKKICEIKINKREENSEIFEKIYSIFYGAEIIKVGDYYKQVFVEGKNIFGQFFEEAFKEQNLTFEKLKTDYSDENYKTKFKKCIETFLSDYDYIPKNQ